MPSIRSSARCLSTSRNASREDLDRFIPSRRRMNMDLCRRKLSSDVSKPRESSRLSSITCFGPASAARRSKLAYQKQLLSTLCSVSSSDLDDDSQLKSIFQYGNVSPLKTSNGRSQHRSVGAAAAAAAAAVPFEMDFLRSSKTCLSQDSLIANTINTNRAINCRPVTILDAPFIVNDFYTHPLSWSKDNVLAVALGSIVYLMNASTKAVHELVDVRTTTSSRDTSARTDSTSNRVMAVKWCTIDGLAHFLAVGTRTDVRVYDTVCRHEVPISRCTGGLVRALCWNDSRQWLTVGYATGKVVNMDCRSGTTAEMSRRFTSVSSVCNVAWNPEGTCLASGLNDNAIHLWDASMMRNVQARCGPRLVLESHTAAVKGLAWCPYRRNLLASGGGSADRCIKLWDACSGRELRSVNTGSQVASLLWGRHRQELYSGHGFSRNTVAVWSYPKLEHVESLSHHKDRILSMDMSPDGCQMASISADESLCIWKLEAATAVRSGADHTKSPYFGLRFAIR